MVKPGYKQTELGIIPEDWDYTVWENAGSGFSSGATPYRGIKRYYSGNVKWVSSGELNYNVINETLEHISDEAKTKTNLKLHPANTFLMAITGLEAAGTRGSCAILGVPATTNQSCMAVYETDRLNIRYLFYFYSKNGDNLAFKYCQGTKQQSYTAAIVKKLPIILPPVSEQKRIAEALSDVDSMISSLEKLIAKKKAVKQGAMQELLTGKKRLPGFTGDIEYKSLASLCTVFADGDWIESKDQSNDGIRLIQTGNIGIGKYLDKADKQRFISEDTFNRLKCLAIFENDVLVSRLPDPAGRACILPHSIKRRITAVDCTIIRFNNYDPILFVAFSQTKEYQGKVEMAMAGSTRQRISRKELGEILIPVFPLRKEQTAIASILSDMDNEIEALEQKLAKTRQVKQGMMQQLLTGKIRLV